MGFKAGNNQWFILFRVAGKDGKWRTSQVNNLLDNLGIVATAYMDHPKIIGFAQHDKDNHEIVKLIEQAHSSGSSDCVHWASDSTTSKVFKKLTANLRVPIMASQGSQRERKAPERFKPVEEPKKPRRCADTESDNMPSDEEIAAQLVRYHEKAVGSSVDKRRANDETQGDFVPDKRARVDDFESFANVEEACNAEEAPDLSVPIMASEGSHRERKAPERFKPVEKLKNPSKCAVSDTESDDVPADEEIAAQLVRCREKACRENDETMDDFVPDKRARVDDIESFANVEEACNVEQALEPVESDYEEIEKEATENCA